MTIHTFLRAADETARTADDLSREFARELAAVLKGVERRLRPLVQRAADGSRTAVIRAAQANRLRRQLRELLTAAGYDALVTNPDQLDRLVVKVLEGRRLADLSADLVPLIAKRIDALKALIGVDLLGQGDQAARELWKAATRGLFGAQSVDRILTDLGDVLDRTEPQIQTLYDTSISIFGRQVEALQAGHDPETRFAFVGPVDGKTRPWCLRHVGRIYTRAEIDALDNGQIGPVFLTGGGYNCRHTWMEIARSSELWDFAGTRQRIPEVQQDLDRLEEAA